MSKINKRSLVIALRRAIKHQKALRDSSSCEFDEGLAIGLYMKLNKLQKGGK